MQTGRFEGKTVVVTGAGSGIGKAVTERAVSEGGRVVATDIVAERLNALHDELGDAVTTIVGDISDAETCQQIVEAAQGRVDALANVAGIMDGFLPLHELDDSTWERVLGVNLTGVMRLTRSVIPLMMQAGRGSIVNVGSEAGVRGSCAGTAYTTSKHALNGLSKSIAFFYQPHGIRCNVVAPGGVETSIVADFHSEFAGARMGPILQGLGLGVASAQQVAATITWLLSDDSSNVSGAIIPDDGGWAAI